MTSNGKKLLSTLFSFRKLNALMKVEKTFKLKGITHGAHLDILFYAVEELYDTTSLYFLLSKIEELPHNAQFLAKELFFIENIYPFT